MSRRSLQLQKLKDKERDLLQKDREIQRKEKDLQAKDRDLKKANEALDRSKQPLKNFIQDEIRKSYAAVAEAKQAHSQSPSKYTAGFIEIAKGSHAENEELLKRLATAVGIDYSSLDLDLEAVEKKQQIEDVRRLVEKEPRKVSFQKPFRPSNTRKLTVLASSPKSIC